MMDRYTWARDKKVWRTENSTYFSVCFGHVWAANPKMSLRKRTNLTDSEINQILFATPVEESEGECFEHESEDEINPPPEDVEGDTYDDISVHVECEVFADAAFEEYSICVAPNVYNISVLVRKIHFTAQVCTKLNI